MRSLVLVVLLHYSFFAFSQITPKYVRSYGPEVNKSGEAVYAVATDNNGLLFFATDKGVLFYDGGQWQMILIDGEAGVRSIEYDSLREKIWVGGLNTFGYLEQDRVTRYRYVSISDSVFKAKPFKQVWQIYFDADQVLFVTNEAHYQLTNQHLEIKDRLNTYFYQVGSTSYLTTRSGKLSVLSNGEEKVIWDHSKIIREAIFQIVPLSATQNLLISPYDGVFVHSLATNTVTRYKAPLSDLLIKKPFYTSAMVNDSVMAVGSWFDGILLCDLKGKMIDQCTVENGMLSNGVSDLQMDRFGKLWAATDYGISVVDLKNALPTIIQARPKEPQSIITSVVINRDSVIYVTEPTPVLSFSRKPSTLELQFATPGMEYLRYGQHLIKLDGVDTSWSSCQAHIKEYADLPNGNYTFRVKAISPNESILEGSISFSIDEPWYAFLVDRSTYILTGAAFFGLLIFSITYPLRTSKKMLTKMVAQKTQEIEERGKQLEVMNKNLIQANEELDIFLYRSSHDLISPVKSIKGLLSLMKLSKEDQSTYIQLMEDRINRLERILTEINSYVKNTKRELVVTRFNFRELILEIWSEIEFLENAAAIDLQIDMEEDFTLAIDRDRWKMVLSNLMANAVKYHDGRKPHPFIRISMKEENGYHFYIEDNGQGIKKEYQSRLFEMFYRANEGSNGTGLGLFLVKKVIDSLQGTIQITSTLGQGTRVEITLPRTAGAEIYQPIMDPVATNA